MGTCQLAPLHTSLLLSVIIPSHAHKSGLSKLSNRNREGSGDLCMFCPDIPMKSPMDTFNIRFQCTLLPGQERGWCQVHTIG